MLLDAGRSMGGPAVMRCGETPVCLPWSESPREHLSDLLETPICLPWSGCHQGLRPAFMTAKNAFINVPFGPQLLPPPPVC